MDKKQSEGKMFPLQAIYAYRDGNMAQFILKQVLDALEWSASRPGRFNPREVRKGKSIPLQT